MDINAIYKSRAGHVFPALEMEKFGEKYVIDINDLAMLKAYPLKEVATLGTINEFLMEYYPDYERSQNVADLDDLACLIAGECEREKLERLTEIYGSDPKYWELEEEKLYWNMVEKAIENYNKNSHNNGI